MTSEHFCQKHQTAFFKKGNMRAFAHPVKDSEGNTISWCPEDKVKKEESQTIETKPIENDKPSMTKEDWAERERTTRTSIERQTALKEANSFVCEMRKLLGKPVEGDSGLVIKVACFWEGYLRGDIKYDSKAMTAFLVKMAEEDFKPKPKQETK